MKFPTSDVAHGIGDGVVKLKHKPKDVHIAVWPANPCLIWRDHNRQVHMERISKRVASVLISKGFSFEG